MNPTHDTIRRVVLRWLARRDYSQHEIRQKLQAKGKTEPDISTILADLSRMGWLDDARFVENYTRSRRAKGYGPLRISLELQARGITREMIAEQLDITDNAWFITAHKVWQKQMRSKTNIDPIKQMRFLQYRGFTREQIDHALKFSEEENS